MNNPNQNDGQTPPPLRRLALDAWHRARGARMVAFAGWDMPVQYAGIITEHQWTRAHAGLFDVSHMGQLSLTGAGAAAALEALVPGDITGLAPGRMRYTLLLNEDGGILDDLIVTNLGSAGGDRLHLVVNGATAAADIAHLRAHLPEGVSLTHLAKAGLLALQGPAAAAVLERIVPGVAALGFMQFGTFMWAGEPIGISRSGYTGEDGFEISVPASHIESLANALADQPEARPCGLGARDSLRLEAGLPLYGHDLSPAIDPVGAGLGFAISKRRRVEGKFPGAARILAALAEGPPTRRVGLTLEGKAAAREGAEIFAGASRVGVVTSGGFAPSLDHAIAMGFVTAAQATPDTALTIEVRGRHLPATVTPLPFVPHRYTRGA